MTSKFLHVGDLCAQAGTVLHVPLFKFRHAAWQQGSRCRPAAFCLMWFVLKVTLAARIAAEGRGIVAVVNKLDTIAPHSRQQVRPNA